MSAKCGWKFGRHPRHVAGASHGAPNSKAVPLRDILRHKSHLGEAEGGASTIVHQMHRFQEAALGSADDLDAAFIPDSGRSILGGAVPGQGIPRRDQLRSIKSQ